MRLKVKNSLLLFFCRLIAELNCKQINNKSNPIQAQEVATYLALANLVLVNVELLKDKLAVLAVGLDVLRERTNKDLVLVDKVLEGHSEGPALVPDVRHVNDAVVLELLTDQLLVKLTCNSAVIGLETP